ncbi:MAG: hypothetical protein H6529_16370 [Nocardioides sp.]|nr:hypothetical protein [Nocardioidaceae bacterium]MCB8958043.1 hypothetical protein [Nocardioides sp.]
MTDLHNGRNAAYAVGYLLLALLGAGLLATTSDRDVGLLGGLLLLVVAAGGLVLVGHDAWFVRHRPGVSVATAPSGVRATAFVRSGVPTVMSAVMPALLAAWAVVGCVVADAPAARVILALVALGFASPLVAVARGRVVPGGLYLTPAGVEQRKEAVSWSISWDELAGAVPSEPLALTLAGPPPQPVVRTRWLWQREPTAPAGVVAVDSRYLAEDPVVVVGVVARCIVDPALRQRMGSDEVVAEIRR